MKILIIIHNQAGTGPYDKVMEMAKSLTLHENHVTLLCTSPANKIAIKKIEIDNLYIIESPDLLWGSLRQGMDLWNTFRRIFYLRKYNFDIVHAIDCRPVVILPALWLKWRKKIPLLLSWWDWFGRGGTVYERSGKIYAATLGRFETFFEEYFRRFADQATVVTSALQKRLIALDYPAEMIHLVRVGTVTSNSKSQNKAELRKELNLNIDKKIIVYAGTLFEKDKNLLIDALRNVKKSNKDLPLTVLIGNHDVDENIRIELSVICTGFLPSKKEVEKYLYAADYGILPMHTSIANIARWPSKFTDYLSAGLPVITTPISDFLNIYEKYNIGYISLDDNAKSLASMILCGIDTNLQSYKKMVSAGQNYLEKELDWRIISGKLKNIYQSLIN